MDCQSNNGIYIYIQKTYELKAIFVYTFLNKAIIKKKIKVRLLINIEKVYIDKL